MQFHFDASTVAPQEAFEPLPASWYTAMITEADLVDTKDGLGKMIKLTYEILGGDYNKRKTFNNLNVYNKNPQAVDIAYRELSAICHAIHTIQMEQLEDLLAKPFLVKVGLRPARRDLQTGKDYEAQNEIKGHKPIDPNAPPVLGPSKASQVNGGYGGGAPAWAGGAPGQAPAWAQPAAPQGYPPQAAAPQWAQNPAAAAQGYMQGAQQAVQGYPNGQPFQNPAQQPQQQPVYQQPQQPVQPQQAPVGQPGGTPPWQNPGNGAQAAMGQGAQPAAAGTSATPPQQMQPVQLAVQPVQNPASGQPASPAMQGPTGNGGTPPGVAGTPPWAQPGSPGAQPQTPPPWAQQPPAQG